jgi:hypothetical protein
MMPSVLEGPIVGVAAVLEGDKGGAVGSHQVFASEAEGCVECAAEAEEEVAELPSDEERPSRLGWELDFSDGVSWLVEG